jgi:F0F1-type ATP synthase assembly protein I
VSTIHQTQDFQEERLEQIMKEDTSRTSKWPDRIWIMAVAGQAGLFIAIPVIAGFGLGILLDRQLNTIILFAVLFAMLGFGGGAYLVYNWVKNTVAKRLDEQRKED